MTTQTAEHEALLEHCRAQGEKRTRRVHDARLGIGIGVVFALQLGVTVVWVAVMLIVLLSWGMTKLAPTPTVEVMLVVHFFCWPFVFVMSWGWFAVTNRFKRDAVPRLWLVIAITGTVCVQMALSIAFFVVAYLS